MTALPTPVVPANVLAMLFAQVGEHLDAELALHRRFLALTRAKQRHIVSGDMAAFSALLQQEQVPLADLVKLRQRRDLLVKAAVQALGLANERPVFVQVLEKAPEAQRGELRRRQGELKTLLEELREANECAMALIRQSLSFVRDLLGCLVGDAVGGRPTNGYDRRGAKPGPLGEGRLINTRG